MQKKAHFPVQALCSSLCLLLVGCTVLVALAGCSQSEPKQLPVLRVGHAPHDHHASLYIAAMNPDFFRENGGIFFREVHFGREYVLVSGSSEIAKVVIDSSTGGKKLIRALAEGHNDLSFGGVPAMLSFIDQGSDIHILMPVMGEGAGLVVHKNMPVSNWDEFVNYVNSRDEPVKIGYKITVSVQNLIFEKALDSLSIPFASNGENIPDDTRVILVNLFGAKNLIPALENEVIDGFVVNQPFVAMAEYRGSGRMIASLSDLPPAGRWNNNPCCALAGNKKFISGNSRVVEPFLKLMLRANRFITEHPEQSAEQIARWLNIAPEIEQLSLPTIRYMTGYSEEWHRGVNFWVESMISSGKLDQRIKSAYEQGTLLQEVYDMQVYNSALKNN